MHKKILVLYNPLSGKGINEAILYQCNNILINKGYEVDFIETKYQNHAANIMETTEKYDIVFSIGGDGTLNEVVRGNYLRKEKIPICPIPNGTCNDFATMLGYNKDTINSIYQALDGEIHNLDIGTINDTPFTYVAGMGKFMSICYETKKEDKNTLGYIAYIKAAINEIKSQFKKYKVEITIDGKTFIGTYSLIMVSNSNHIAGINNFHKNVYLNDGKFEILLCKAKNKLEFITNFLDFFTIQNSKEIVHLKAKNIIIKPLEQIDKNWCIDGEKYNKNINYKISVQGQMPFLIPKNKVKTLLIKK